MDLNYIKGVNLGNWLVLETVSYTHLKLPTIA